MNVTGNTMTCEHFVDFYMLEALQARISMAKATHPEFQFRESVLKLEDDVNKAFEHLSSTMAFRIYVYLWGAALGEAEYANENCENAISQLSNFSYHQTFDYFPTEHNVQMVIDTFEQEWSDGGFGGDAWANIVEGMALYGKITNAAFVDHCVDLEHNGGCAFNKTGREPFKFDCYTSFGGRALHGFLDHKFQNDILNTPFTWYSIKVVEVSWKVYNLVARFNNVIEKVNAVEFLSPTLEWLSAYEVEWEEDSYNVEFEWEEANGGVHCNYCGCGITSDEAYYLESHDAYYCSDCVETCEHCGETVHKNDTQWIDGECETWCDDCATEHKATCDECGKDYHYENTNTTEDDYTLCGNCTDEHLCDECGEIHYDMEYHKEHEHAVEEIEEETKTQLPFDSDGVFEIVDNFDFQTKYNQHEEVLFLIETREVEIINCEPKIVVGYKVGDLFVLKHEGEYVILTPFKLWFKPKNAIWFNAITLANKAKDVVQWNQFTTPNEWADFAEENESIVSTLRQMAQEV